MGTIQATKKQIARLLHTKIATNISNVSEELPYFLQEYNESLELDEMFNTIINHTTETTLLIQPNMLAIYCRVMIPDGQYEIDMDDTITYHQLDSEQYFSEGTDLLSSSWDFHTCRGQSTGTMYRAVPLYYIPTASTRDQLHIGIVFPALNSVVLCDLTHNRETLPLLVRVINDLKRRGLITYTIKKQKKKRVPKKRYPTITMGGDPEFEVLRNGRVISLRHDGIPYRGISESTNAAVGVDADGHPVELRPMYNASPSVLVRNIRTLFGSVDKDAHFSSIGNTFPIGGHIHVGLGKEVHPDNNLLFLLDYFVGRHTMKMSGHARAGYHRPSAYEPKSYGFEYRTPPSAIYATPKMAHITLKLTKNIVERYIRRKVFELENQKASKFQELITYGGLTPDQAKYFWSFTRNFKKTEKYNRNVLAYWRSDAKHKPVPKTPPFNIRFNDDWDMSIRDLVSIAIQSIKIKPSIPIDVCLYGLKEDRGTVVAGFESTQYERISHPNHSDQHLIILGLPFHFRMSHFSVDGRDALIEEVKQHILTCVSQTD